MDTVAVSEDRLLRRYRRRGDTAARGEGRRRPHDHSWAVHVPRPLQERVLAVSQVTDELRVCDGRAPTPQQIADAMGEPLEDVLEALQAGRAHGAASLEAPLGGDPLRSLRGLLDDRDREVLRLRFLCDLTQTQIAERVGCSQMQVSRILRRALGRLSEAAQPEVEGGDRRSGP